MLIYFLGNLGLKFEKMCYFKIYFNREVVAQFYSSNCHFNGNNLYFHNI